MSAWTSDQLEEIGAADELELTTFRPDGTPHKPVTSWLVRNGDSLFIRSWRGRNAAWFRNAQARQAGHIQAGGIDTDVKFVNDDQSMNDTIDAAYRAKYTPTAPSYVEPMLSVQARSTTLQLVPRS